MDSDICLACSIDPTSHSFMKIKEINGVSYYYTCPAQSSKYNDTNGILTHYENVLKLNGEHPWIWIIDCAGFSLKYATEIKTAIGISNLLTSKYGEQLQEILVKNPTWHVHSLLYIIWPFLSTHIQSIVVIDNNDKTPRLNTEENV